MDAVISLKTKKDKQSSWGDLENNCSKKVAKFTGKHLRRSLYDKAHDQNLRQSLWQSLWLKYKNRLHRICFTIDFDKFFSSCSTEHFRVIASEKPS